MAENGGIPKLSLLSPQQRLLQRIISASNQGDREKEIVAALTEFSGVPETYGIPQANRAPAAEEIREPAAITPERVAQAAQTGRAAGLVPNLTEMVYSTQPQPLSAKMVQELLQGELDTKTGARGPSAVDLLSQFTRGPELEANLQSQKALLDKLRTRQRPLDLSSLAPLARMFGANVKEEDVRPRDIQGEQLTEQLAILQKLRGGLQEQAEERRKLFSALTGGGQTRVQEQTKFGPPPAANTRAIPGQEAYLAKLRSDFGKVDDTYAKDSAHMQSLAGVLKPALDDSGNIKKDDQGRPVVNWDDIRTRLGEFLRIAGEVGNNAVAEGARMDIPTLEKTFAVAKRFVTGEAAEIPAESITNIMRLVMSAKKRIDTRRQLQVESVVRRNSKSTHANTPEARDLMREYTDQITPKPKDKKPAPKDELEGKSREEQIQILRKRLGK